MLHEIAEKLQKEFAKELFVWTSSNKYYIILQHQIIIDKNDLLLLRVSTNGQSIKVVDFLELAEYPQEVLFEVKLNEGPLDALIDWLREYYCPKQT